MYKSALLLLYLLVKLDRSNLKLDPLAVFDSYFYDFIPLVWSDWELYSHLLATALENCISDSKIKQQSICCMREQTTFPTSFSQWCDLGFSFFILCFSVVMLINHSVHHSECSCENEKIMKNRKLITVL